MTRPYTICHVLSSVDGRIAGPFMGSPTCAPAISAYGRLAGELDAQATIYGFNTMRDFCPGLYEVPGVCGDATSAADHIADAGARSLIVAMDRNGELAYAGPTMQRRGRESHLVAALTQRASEEYLAYLRDVGVSYLICGEADVDCDTLLEKLASRFRVRRAIVAGGGCIDWSFLAAGCLDELSLVVAPVADGTPGAASVFERVCGHERDTAMPLRLAASEDLGDGVLWLRYETA